jgi:hypothetical protein
MFAERLFAVHDPERKGEPADRVEEHHVPEALNLVLLQGGAVNENLGGIVQEGGFHGDENTGQEDEEAAHLLAVDTWNRDGWNKGMAV